MLMSTLLALVLLPPCASAGGILDGLSPDIDAFRPVHVRYGSGGGSVITALFRRADNATLRVRSETYRSVAERREAVANGIESNMQMKPKPGSAQDTAMRKLTGGEPAGDQVYRFEEPARGTYQLAVGLETFSVHTWFQYEGTKEGGTVKWRKADFVQDRALAEDVLRRVVGRMLAWQHVQAVRDRTLPSSANDVTDSAGKRFVSVASWVASQGGVSASERSVGRRFTHSGRPILILTGADKIKVGDQWIGIGGYVMEVNNKPSVPLQGLLAALR